MSKSAERRRAKRAQEAEYAAYLRSVPKAAWQADAELEAGTLPMDEEIVQAFVDEELATLRAMDGAKDGDVANRELGDNES